MNKKGFTLIELLAVVAIIALIGGLALGIVAKLSSDRRKDGNALVNEFVINAAKQYVKNNTAVKERIMQNTNEIITYQSLIDKGYLNSTSIKNLETGTALNLNTNYVCVTYNSSNKQFDYNINKSNCITSSSGNSGNSGTQTTILKCKRAKTLHSSGSIIYGNKGTSGTLKMGDAFDCDVNKDGIYDAPTERFYYVSDYYDTQSKSFNSSYAVLSFYKNIQSDSGGIKYTTGDDPGSGPQTARNELPTTSEWSNVSLYKTTRAILNEKSENTYTCKEASTNSCNLTKNFDYTGKAARLLTYQELSKNCGNLRKTNAIKDNCSFITENGANSWLETVTSSYYRKVWYSNTSMVLYNNPNYINVAGLRPVIEVLKTDMEI